MSMAVKPGYVNPLTMMGKKKTLLNPEPNQKQNSEKSEKSNDVKDLQTKQQGLQNQILLMKSTTDGSVETEALEQKLEEISAELQTAKSQEVQTVDLNPPRERFDRYEHVKEQEESYGQYKLQQEEDNNYKVLFTPYSEQQ